MINKTINYKIVGFAICALLLVNILVIFCTKGDQSNIKIDEKYNLLINHLFQKKIKDTIFNIRIENESTYRITSNTNDNWAPNPSFEIGCCTLPSGWTYSIDDKSKFHWDTLYSHTGGKSIGVLNLTENTNRSYWITTEFIPVDFINNTYDFSGWYFFIGKPLEGIDAAFSLYMYNEQYLYLGHQDFLCNFSSEWKYMTKNTSSYHSDIINETKFVKLALFQYYTKNEPNPSIEVRFDDIYFGYGNVPPNTPIIRGETNGAIHTTYNYTIHTSDVDQNEVKYYIDWGDNTHNITDLYQSEEEIIVSHSWENKGNYSIKVKASDENYAESDWATLKVIMPDLYFAPLNRIWIKMQERFPHEFPIMRTLFRN